MHVKRFVSQSNLVIDLGMNNGDDSAYYLARGFRVVGVEANPELCIVTNARFAAAIANGRLEIINAAITDSIGLKIFYINRAIDHWSSLDAAWAGRDGHLLEPITIDGLPIAALFAHAGTPVYLKVDVEGADELVLDQLALLDELPQYLSVEDCRFGFRYLEKMTELGYCEFQLLDQSQVPQLVDPVIQWRFLPGASGPFGEALPGRWINAKEMMDYYSQIVRDRDGHRRASRTHWWDIHARGPIEAM